MYQRRSGQDPTKEGFHGRAAPDGWTVLPQDMLRKGGMADLTFARGISAATSIANA
jgi:hypothetical protein